MQPYHDGTPKINGMNCCEALNALCFKWSSWDEALGPKQQPESWTPYVVCIGAVLYVFMLLTNEASEIAKLTSINHFWKLTVKLVAVAYMCCSVIKGG